MVAEFSRFAIYDDGNWDKCGFLKCNHSVFLLMPWCNLKSVVNKAILAELRDRDRDRSSKRELLEIESSKIDPWYVLAFLNSAQMRELLAGFSRSSIPQRLQPNDLYQISIPVPDDPKVMKSLANLAKQTCRIKKEILRLRDEGWEIENGEVSAPAVVPDGIPRLMLDRARVKWELSILPTAENANVHKLKRIGHELFHGNRIAARISPHEKPMALEWLRRQLLCLPEGTTLGQAMRMNDFRIPETPESAEKAFKSLERMEASVREKIAQAEQNRDSISRELQPLFRKTT
jgi:hypothetical protein